MLNSQMKSQMKLILPFLKQYNFTKKANFTLLCKKNNFEFGYTNSNDEFLRVVFGNPIKPCQLDSIEVYKDKQICERESAGLTSLWLDYLASASQSETQPQC